MNTSHQREAAIFDAAMELPPERRSGYLDEACGADAALRRRVESLLKACESQCVFLDAPADEIAPAGTVGLPVSEKPGETIGRYKLLEQIGEGGCGIVYVAEQAVPVRRRVALKIIKLGMDTRSVIARFEAERQALALMDHPNIAKVFDAGATETGRPYFVMELVRGMKITEFCDEKKLGTRARLDLFIQVCQAIQHAHQKGIIHRDIKPSNILVTMNDGIAVPKVIDFGIAKATSGQQLTDKTIYTAFEQFIGTPAYMSPEQAVLTSLDIDTRSDIYALGVLLYELLTGKTPFDAKELIAIGLDEMRRTIRDQEPQRPSTRLSTLAQNELSTTAQRRGLDAPKLVSELRGDLDWIVMKALEKDRARRYETANGLATDIQRHLNNETVVARPPSRLYRFQKTVQRNRLAFSAAASVIAALTVGLAISTWRFVKEREALRRAMVAEQAAKEEKDAAEAVLQFVRDKILAAGRPNGKGGGVGKDVTLREAIDRAESKIAKAFTNRPLVEAAIRKTWGETYLYLGEPALALQQLERAFAARRETLGLENEHTVRTMDLLAAAYAESGKHDQAISLSQETLKWQMARLGPKHPETLVSMNSLGTAYSRAGKLDQALPLLEETLRLRKAALGPDHYETIHAMGNLGEVYRRSGKLEEAIPLLSNAVWLGKAKVGAQHLDADMNNLGLAYRAARRFEEAILLLEESVSLARTNLGPNHYQTLLSMYNLGLALWDAGNRDRAASLWEQSFKLAKAKDGQNDDLKFLTMRELLRARRYIGNLDEQFLREYLAGIRSHHTNDPVKLAEWLYDVAEFRYRQGNHVEAAPLYREIVELRRAALGVAHGKTLEATASLGRLLSDWVWVERDLKSETSETSETRNPRSEIAGRAREAERLLREVLVARQRESTNSWRVDDVKSRLGGALISVAVTDSGLDVEGRETKLTAAESLLLESHEQLKKRSSDKKYTRDSLQRLVRLYEARNKPDKRSDWQGKLELFDKAQTKSSTVD